MAARDGAPELFRSERIASSTYQPMRPVNKEIRRRLANQLAAGQNDSHRSGACVTGSATCTNYQSHRHWWNWPAWLCAVPELERSLRSTCEWECYPQFRSIRCDSVTMSSPRTRSLQVRGWSSTSYRYGCIAPSVIGNQRYWTFNDWSVPLVKHPTLISGRGANSKSTRLNSKNKVQIEITRVASHRRNPPGYSQEK